MYDIINPILQWLNEHPNLSGIGTFIISAAESIAIIGTIVPGSVMMTAIGALAGSGVIPLWQTIIWAILGAVVGDGISYWIGRKFKHHLYDVWPFRYRPNLLKAGELFFKKYGGMSVFIGRFVGPVRALVPLVAGMLGMKPVRFYFANILSAIGWAPAYMLPGILLGAASLELPPDLAVHAILIVLLGTLFIILCIWLIYKFFVLVGNQITHFLNKLWAKLEGSRYFHSITTVLKHHDSNQTHGQLTLAFFIILLSILFLYFSAYILTHPSKDIFINNVFFHMFRGSRTPLFDNIMVLITMLGESKIVIVVIAALFIWLAWNKRWHTAWHVLALGILTSISIEFFKHIVHSQRPWGIMQSPHGASFPSGHATFATVIYGGLALLLTKACQQRYRHFFYAIAALIIVSVAASRLYLGAHWLTDVLGGILLGIILLMVIVLSYNRKTELPLSPAGIIITAFLTLFVTGSIYGYFNFNRLKMNSTQLEWPSNSVTLESWWNQRGKDLPLYRMNRFGFSTQILNIQWIGDINEINSLLQKNGWQIPQEQGWIDALHRITDIQSTEHLPMVSPLYFDKKPVLVLIKQNNGTKKLIVLRLWNSNVIISNSKQLLWVGSVENVPRTYNWLFRRRSNELNFTPSSLFVKIPKQYDIKELTVTTSNKRRPKQQMILIKPKRIQ